MLTAVRPILPKRTKLEDEEIEAMAQEIREANRKKMALAAPNPTLTRVSQPVSAPTSPSKVLSDDHASQQGQFGWADCEGKFIPYLIRSVDKYVAQRIIEDMVISKFGQFFSNEVYNCCLLGGVEMTQAEANLLNEINIRHCDMSFGKALFQAKDNMIKLQDVLEMAEFLKFCHAVVIAKDTSIRNRCGFVSIASTSCVPYVWLKGKQYVPLFFFDGKCEYLQEKASDLSGWELAYLKLLCKMQGVRKEFFDTDAVRVAELDHVKELLEPGTALVESWPSTYRTNTLLLKRDRKQDNKTLRLYLKPALSLQPVSRAK